MIAGHIDSGDETEFQILENQSLNLALQNQSW